MSITRQVVRQSLPLRRDAEVITANQSCRRDRPSVMIYNSVNICFRPDSLPPALPWQLAGRRHGVSTTGTLPGSTTSDYAIQRGNVGTARVNATTAVVPGGRALLLLE